MTHATTTKLSPYYQKLRDHLIAVAKLRQHSWTKRACLGSGLLPHTTETNAFNSTIPSRICWTRTLAQHSRNSKEV